MVCPVCGKKSEYQQCPQCGFDSSRDYEKYPTLMPVGKTPAVSARRKAWNTEKRPDEVVQRKRPWLALIACVAMLVLGIGIGVGLSGGKPALTDPGENVQVQTPPDTTKQTAPPETTEATKPTEMPWSKNVLWRDDSLDSADLIYDVDGSKYHVFGSKYARGEICSITFLDTLQDAPQDAWDASENRDRKVLAWVIPNGGLYDLYIGAEGGISAGESCECLFAGYTNITQINNMHFLHTENVRDMGDMFTNCTGLKTLDLSSFDTGKLESMHCMFFGCESLVDLNLCGFDTANVDSMGFLFHSCESLTELDLSSFDTGKVDNMSYMFAYCRALTKLDLSNFDTRNVEQMFCMFDHCQALTSLDLSSFDTSNVLEMEHMFGCCISLTDLILGDHFVATNVSPEDLFDECPAGADWQHLLK